ncbi:MAG: ABC transporter substrate-binding protein [Nitrososphaerota archaeon]|nr:ABC transporter substrate-binding protein [Nitrososphaerota archaeon]
MTFLAISLLITPVLAQYRAPHTQPGPAVDKVIYKRVPLDLAPKALEAGDVDIYQFGLRGAQAKALAGRTDITLYTAPSGLNDVILNPAPAPAGELNPLSNKKIRLALQYVFNREFLVTNVFAGFAAPMVTFLSSYDPDYATIFDIIAKYEFKYDPALAAQIVDEEMTRMGAEKIAGKWYYNGKPVTLKFLIRIEDERRELGDAFATELEKLGFTIERIYVPFGVAIEKLYGTDPKDFEWHLYTEGWGKTGVDKYDYTTINQYNAPWFGYMPGWQEAGYWQYENNTIDELGLRIYQGQFKSREERNNLYRRITEMGIQESIRIWGITRFDVYAVRAEVTGLTNDVGAGLRAWHVIRNAYIPGKNTLQVGHLWVWTERSAWNPVGGFEDVYSVDIAASTCDPAMSLHPFNGLPTAIRAAYDVETAGPDGVLDVPSDAVVWDAINDKWVNVPAGTKAISKVTFDYSKFFNSKWHHGVKISLADLLYNLASLWDLVMDPEKNTTEPAVASLNAPFFQILKGIRILPDERVEVYVDYWHFEPAYVANMANVWVASYPCMTTPWEIRAAMDKLVFEKKAFAYSDSAATKLGVPWLSLVLKDHAAAAANAIKEMKSEGFFPESWFRVGGKIYETRDGALARYDAASKWHDAYGLMWIGNGPFMLTKFDPAAQYAELTAYRDETYPFKPGDNFWGIPEPVEITGVGKSTIVPGGESMLIVDVKGPSPLHTKYLVKDPLTGQVIRVGEGERVTPTRFAIRLDPDFTSKLRPGGLYEFTIAAYSDEVAFVAAVKEFVDVLNIEPLKRGVEESAKVVSEDVANRLKAFSEDLTEALRGIEGALGKVAENIMTVNTMVEDATESVRGVSRDISEVDAGVTTLRGEMSDLKDALQNLMTIVTIVLIISVIAVALSAFAILRQRRPT